MFEQEPNIEDESKIGNRNQSNLDGSYCGPLQDKDIDVPSTPQMITRSGRVVKPVRRLIDGYETSIGGENQYGMNDEQIIDDKADAALKDESELPSQKADGLNKMQLASELEIFSKFKEEDPSIGEIGTDSIDNFSGASANNEIDNTPNAKIEVLTIPTTKTDDSQRRLNSPLEEVKLKRLSLFGLNEDLLYQSKDIDTVSDGICINGREKLTTNVSTLQPEQQASVKSLEESVFKDRKSIVKFVLIASTIAPLNQLSHINAFGL